MKFLQVISHYVPAYRYGGPLQVAHALGRALIDRGHSMTVCCTNQRDPASNLDVRVGEPVEVDGVRVFYEHVRYSRRWGYAPAMASRVSALAGEADAMIMHAHFQYASWIGGRAARRAAKPYVVFSHGSLKRGSLAASSGAIKRLYLRALEHRNLRGALRVAFNAEEEMEDSLYAERGVVIPNGISPSDFTTLSERGAWRVRHPHSANRTIYLSFGRVDIRQKAIDVIVAAFAELAAEQPQALLVIAGPSEQNDLAIVQSLIAAKGLRDRVWLLGLVTGREKFELLRDADVFVMPSRYEGLSIALLEAMASGLPVILSNRAGLHRQVLRHNCGLIVEPDVSETLAAMRAMSDANLRHRCGSEARRLALAEHTWPSIAGRVEALFTNPLTKTW